VITSKRESVAGPKAVDMATSVASQTMRFALQPLATGADWDRG
jgi:hypothetical protein